MIEPRILKGFRDYLPRHALKRTEMIRSLERTFHSFGFAPIDTPALEYADVLLGKGSAETDKQMYRFSDNGKRDVALRFDLTIPFARFAAMHANELGVPFKRFHIAPVWRAEKPQRGRYREFVQCDFDTIGTTSMLADAETVAVIHKAFRNLEVNHVVRINNRKLLSGLIAGLGVADSTTAVLRAIDKLEKAGEDTVKQELSSEANLSGEQIEAVLSFLYITDKAKDSASAFSDARSQLSDFPESQEGLDQLQEVVTLIGDFGVPEDCFKLDFSIARGLDYYTGTIFETTCSDLPTLGSIASGGRYDNLASLYTKQNLPGVGASIGLDRVLAGLEELDKIPPRSTAAEVLVTIMDSSLRSHAAQVTSMLRDAGIPSEVFLENKKLGQQLKYADRKGFSLVIIFGEQELEQNTYNIKNMQSGEQLEGVAAEELANTVSKQLETTT